MMFFISILLLINAAITKPASATSSPPRNETDKLALLAFKDRIIRDPLKVMSLWNESTDFCTWTGVSCSSRHEGRVISLNLGDNRLVGSIPPHIGNLSFLRYFSLGNNRFGGEIPQEVGRLFRLRHLNLTTNEIRGRIPSNLSYCRNLEVINLNYNRLVGEIPDDLRILSTEKLRRFSLSVNNLTGSIPAWLANASSLQQLSLAENNFHGSIPSELGRLSKLILFQVAGNELTGTVPSSIFNLTSLLYLDVGTNRLQGRLPVDLGFTLSNLLGLYVPENGFTGPIPPSLTNASGLQILSLAFNGFTGTLPPHMGRLSGLLAVAFGGNYLTNTDSDFLRSLTNCSNLQVLDIGKNNFTGELPASIANFSTKLETLILGTNQFSGHIPKGIENLTGLKRLMLYTNLITGELPSTIGKLENLVDFRLNDNRISGFIPSSVGNCTQLLRIYFHQNQLEGNIPPELGNCRQLQLLSLYQNHLSGIIPIQVASLSSLSIAFMVRENSLSGPLPPEIGNMTNLLQLDVSKNRLSGEIPSTLSNCLMLEELRMDNNFFEGTIPSSLSSLKSLQVLDLSRNNLSGQIPQYLQNFTLLRELNLSFNNFKGDVPREGIFRNVSGFSVTQNKELCGGNDKLGLPKCPEGERKNHNLKIILPIVLVCTASLAAIFLVIFVWRRKTGRKSSDTLLVEEHFPKVSYTELRQATDEFSASNLVGEGSHGSVYKGVLGDENMVIAVKVFNLEHRGASKSFVAECEALRNIRHRNLVKIMTICSSIDYKGADFKALVYKFMDNGSLEDWLHETEDKPKAGNLNIIQRLSIAIDVASAIEYLHHHCQASIVHGDLKPSNVLLDQDMIAHVGDFGLARFLSEIPQTDSSYNHMTSTGIKGTVGYVAPEYGMGGKASMQGDLYSFGILLLEIFTGRRPTDNMFNDGLTLHAYTATALPERVVDIVEPSLQLELQARNNNAETSFHTEGRVSLEECLLDVLRIGVLCSMESPSQRMEIPDVVVELSAIKRKFLGIGRTRDYQ